MTLLFKNTEILIEVKKIKNSKIIKETNSKINNISKTIGIINSNLKLAKEVKAFPKS